jgi:hypothetical protein
MTMLEDAYKPGSWAESVRAVPNPFGNGDSGRRIAQYLTTLLERHLRSKRERTEDLWAG